VTRARQGGANTIATATTVRGTTTLYSLPLDASWEPDLWGSIRNTVRANSLEAEATHADLANMRLSVKAELALDYFQLRSLDAQRELLNSTVVAYEESLRLARVRYETGLASDQDVAQAETQLNTTRAQATDLGIQRAQLEHAIALLSGKPAAELSIPVAPLKAKFEPTPVSLPSTLLERRPDIAAAERRVAAANAQIGVARAAYFPNVSLSGGAGFQNRSVGNLISSPAFFWSVGAELAETLFDAGRRRAVSDQARANYERTVAIYRQTVLTAFQEVEDNLSSLRILRQEIAEQEAAVKSSQRYLTLANDRYKLGIDTYLNVILAQATLLSNQRTAVNLNFQQVAAAVQLIKAVGGGWDQSELQTRNSATNRTSTVTSPR
jgi:NodT family efflux transporter outer membrane factor (OMF) lipoprotein